MPCETRNRPKGKRIRNLPPKRSSPRDFRFSSAAHNSSGVRPFPFEGVLFLAAAVDANVRIRSAELFGGREGQGGQLVLVNNGGFRRFNVEDPHGAARPRRKSHPLFARNHAGKIASRWLPDFTEWSASVKPLYYTSEAAQEVFFNIRYNSEMGSPTTLK